MPLIDLYAEVPEDYDGPRSIYAELSKKQFRMIQEGEVEVEVPFGTTMKNKKGSRGLNFVCENKQAADDLKDGLDASAMSWQEEFISEDL